MIKLFDLLEENPDLKNTKIVDVSSTTCDIMLTLAGGPVPDDAYPNDNIILIFKIPTQDSLRPKYSMFSAFNITPENKTVFLSDLKREKNTFIAGLIECVEYDPEFDAYGDNIIILETRIYDEHNIDDPGVRHRFIFENSLIPIEGCARKYNQEDVIYHKMDNSIDSHILIEKLAKGAIEFVGINARY